MLVGDSFVFKSGSDGRHLWVVVSDPLLNSNEVLILNLTSVHNVPFEDHSCLFAPGEHSWIVKQSYIAYDRARVETSAYLDRLESGTTISMHDTFHEHLLKRIRDGAQATENIELGHLQLLRDQGLL